MTPFNPEDLPPPPEERVRLRIGSDTVTLRRATVAEFTRWQCGDRTLKLIDHEGGWWVRDDAPL